MKRKIEELPLVNKMAGGTSTSNGDSPQNRICRDFLRNVCHRGKRCKYIHERTDDNPIDEYTFCHDYQNGMCNWPGCKFLHCTENEEKHFRTTGELPAHIINRIKNINNDNNKIELPICKDFIKGSCQRLNCKFRHYKKDEIQNNTNNNNNSNNNNCNNNNNNNNINTIQPHINPPRSQQHFNGNSSNNVNGEQRHFEEDRNYHWQIEDQHPMVVNSGYNASPHPGDYLAPPEPKRRIISGETVLHFETPPQLVGQQITSGYYYPVIARNEARTFVLEDENSLLRKKIDELKKKVSDLTATNEFLLDQNAQLRMSGKRTTSVTAVTVPAVTITPTQAPTPQQMVNAAVAAGTLRTVTASVATVPVSIATVTPVSIAAVSMAPVSIPQPIVTMAQQTITMSGVGPQQNNQQQQNSQQTTNLPLSLSGATALSYPIMTQELRPVLQ